MYRRSGMRARQLWRAQAPQVITRTLQGAQPGRQNQRGGRGGAGRKERSTTEVGSWRGWQGRRQRKLLLGVKRQEMEGCEGQRQNVGKCKHFIISSAMFPQLQVSQICPIPRLTPALHSSNGEPLDWVPLPFFTCFFHYCSSWRVKCSREVHTLHSCCVAAAQLIHCRRNYLESLVVSWQDWCAHMGFLSD